MTDHLDDVRQVFTEEDLANATPYSMPNEICPLHNPDRKFDIQLAAVEDPDTPVYLVKLFTRCNNDHEHGFAVIATDFFEAVCEFMVRHPKFSIVAGQTILAARDLMAFMASLDKENLLIEEPKSE